MTANGFINFPSSQILYPLLGALSSKTSLNPSLIILAGALGNTLGNILLFELIKTKGEAFAKKHFTSIYRGVKIIEPKVSTNGKYYLYLAKLTPSVKVFVPIFCGLSNLSRAYVYTMLSVTSFFWATALVSLGRFIGEQLDFTYYFFGVFLIIFFIYIWKRKHIHDFINEVSK